MVFETIKKHFESKKAKSQPTTYYAVELKNNDTVYVVEQKAVEIMLANNCSIQQLWSCSYVKSIGWHQGNDGKIYERHKLSDSGKTYYDLLKIENYGPKYIELLNEINEYDLPFRYNQQKTGMYWDICWNFKSNNVKSIKKYDGKELAKAANTPIVEDAVVL